MTDLNADFLELKRFNARKEIAVGFHLLSTTSETLRGAQNQLTSHADTSKSQQQPFKIDVIQLDLLIFPYNISAPPF